MSIFDNFLKPSEKEKVRSAEQSFSVISEMIKGQEHHVDMSTHTNFIDRSKSERKENVYKFTVKLLSLDFLNKVSKDRRVSNVYFAARHAHPGGSVDGISLRQRIIIEYY